MPLEIQKEQSQLQVGIEGDLTVYQVAEYREQLVAKCKDIQEVRLDMSKLADLDTAGVQFLLAWRKQLRSAGVELSVVGIAEQALQVLDVFNLTDQITVTVRE